ncbi:MAG: phage tail tape measure protein, partial [Fusobacteriaceae bacterium]
MLTLRSAVNEIVMLDKNLAKVNTLLDQQVLSSTNLKMELLQVSDATGIYASELASASYEALSAGVATGELTGFIEKMTVLSQGGFTSVTQAVNVTTSIMNAYGKEVYTVEQVSDKLVKTQALGKTTVDELSRSLYNVVPAATSMGIGLDDVLASIAVLTASGTPTAQATTQIRQALLEMGDEASVVGKTIQGLTGKSFKDLIREGHSVSDVIAMLSRESEKSGKSIDGLYSSAEAKGAVITLAKGKVEEFNKTVREIGKSHGEADKASKIATDNIESSWTKAANRIKNAFVSPGGTFDLIIKGTAQTVNILMDDLSRLYNFLDKKLVDPKEEYYRKKNEAMASLKDGQGANNADGSQFEEDYKNNDFRPEPDVKTEIKVIDPVAPVAPVAPKGGGSGQVATDKYIQAAAIEQALLEEQQEAWAIKDSEFKLQKLESEVEFFNNLTTLKEEQNLTEAEAQLLIDEFEYAQFEEEQAFKLEQLEAEAAYYLAQEDGALEHAQKMADIAELKAQNIKAEIDRESELQ